MHKSGTSMVSALLHRSGIVMGEGRDVDGAYDDGVFFERREFRALNEAMIGAGDPAELHAALTPPHATHEDRARMRALIAQGEAGGRDWGFKDPRLCLTYPLWRDELPPHRIVAIHRDLGEVWDHYRRAPWNPPARLIVRSWCEYNARLVAILEGGASPAILLHYDRLVTDDREFVRLARFLGRPLVDARRPELRRSRPVGRMRLAALGTARACLGRASPRSVAQALARLHAASISGVDLPAGSVQIGSRAE